MKVVRCKICNTTYVKGLIKDEIFHEHEHDLCINGYESPNFENKSLIMNYNNVSYFLVDYESTDEVIRIIHRGCISLYSNSGYSFSPFDISDIEYGVFVIVAVKGNKMIGFNVLKDIDQAYSTTWVNYGDYENTIKKNGNFLGCLFIGVLEKYQKKGIGYKMLDLVFEEYLPKSYELAFTDLSDKGQLLARKFNSQRVNLF